MSIKILLKLLNDNQSELISKIETSKQLQIDFAKALLKHASISFTENDSDYLWDGENLNLHLLHAQSTNFISDLCHEIAHNLTAKKSHRKLPDYGLGSDSYSSIKFESVVTGDKRDSIESRASLFGLLIEAELEVGVKFSACAHGWINEFEQRPKAFFSYCCGNELICNYFYRTTYLGAIANLKWLKRNKFISNEGVPFICNGFEYSVNTL